jgi:hypothetical protein
MDDPAAGIRVRAAPPPECEMIVVVGAANGYEPPRGGTATAIQGLQGV